MQTSTPLSDRRIVPLWVRCSAVLTTNFLLILRVYRLALRQVTA